MNIHYPLADLLTRIRNGQKARQKNFSYRTSTFCHQVLNVLCDEGYILGYRPSSVSLSDQAKTDQRMDVFLKYYEGQPVIQEIKTISKPGNRVYSSVQRLPKAYQGLGIYILSTSKGVMSDQKARSLGIGGEVLCRVF